MDFTFLARVGIVCDTAYVAANVAKRTLSFKCNCNEASSARQSIMSVTQQKSDGLTAPTSASSFYAVPSSTLPCIYLQSSHSVHTIIGSDNLPWQHVLWAS